MLSFCFCMKVSHSLSELNDIGLLVDVTRRDETGIYHCINHLSKYKS
jgi:hypothetical protein